MSWQNYLGLRIREGFRVGIEVEVEGVLQHYEENGSPRSWTAHGDGSLRDGIEFVTSNPTPMSGLNAKLRSLSSWFEGSEPQFSHRTSTHIHVNVSDLTADQLTSFLYMATVMEPLLMRYCSDYRNQNTYCMPTYKTTNLTGERRNLIRFLRDPSHNTRPRRAAKYAAISVFRLFDLGTVEFRMFDGTADPERIKQIVSLLKEIYDHSINAPIQEILDTKYQNGVVSLCSPLIMDIMGHYVPMSELESVIERGVQMANDMLYSGLSEQEMWDIHTQLFPQDRTNPIPDGGTIGSDEQLETVLRNLCNGSLGVDAVRAWLVERDIRLTAAHFSFMASVTGDMDTAYNLYTQLQ